MDSTTNVPLSSIENRAKQASYDSVFAGFDLVNTKKTVTYMLQMIGKNLFFEEYTIHDITHINKMLNIATWLSSEGVEKLTPAEALMLSLSIYFHDLGMLITESEYSNREKGEFNEFKELVLFSGENSEDYKLKIETLGEEHAERFYYSEFVRSFHAERIENWITGKNRIALGDAQDALTEIRQLLITLPEQFLIDLGMVCRSHHEDDLDDLKKYKPRRRYGDSEDDTVNLLHVSVLLRLSDLLHMTTDRTPSTMCKLVNPTDPISQIEWGKQTGVTSVCPGASSNNEHSSSIEVHAFFTQGEFFFALSAFLDYVDEEIERCSIWMKNGAPEVLFPWKSIDREHITTKGFIDKQFQFDMDQDKILKMLTGHTLYNSSEVVIRELVQNSIDAVRFYDLTSNKTRDLNEPAVLLRWTEPATLEVIDYGTGMDMQVIQNNLLKVGASRYSEKDISENFPDFTPISRFGIGILTCFMVADAIDIYTLKDDSELGFHIRLKKVTGRYLVRTLENPLEEPELTEISPHGTKIRLQFRQLAIPENLKEAIGRWIAFPPVGVQFESGDGEVSNVGFGSPKEKLEKIAKSHSKLKKLTTRVSEHNEQGISIAMLETWNDFGKYWQIAYESDIKSDPKSKYSHLEHCDLAIEGISVVQSAPGYTAYAPLISVNAYGKTAPRTNVSRDAIEQGALRENLLLSIHKLLLNRNTKLLSNEETQISRNLQSALTKRFVFEKSETFELSQSREAENLKNNTPMILIEDDGQKIVSINQFKKLKVWTTHSKEFESLFVAMASVKSRKDLALSEAYSFFFDREPLPKPLLSGGLPYQWESFYPTQINVGAGEARIDICWEYKENSTDGDSLLLDTPPGSFHMYGESWFNTLLLVDASVQKTCSNDIDFIYCRPLIIVFSNSEIGKALKSFLDDFPKIKEDLQNNDLKIKDSLSMALDPSTKDDSSREFNTGRITSRYGNIALERLFEIDSIREKSKYINVLGFNKHFQELEDYFKAVGH